MFVAVFATIIDGGRYSGISIDIYDRKRRMDGQNGNGTRNTLW